VSAVQAASESVSSGGPSGCRVWHDGVPRRQLPPPGPAFYPVVVETLTFLFTDIEGSTALLGRLGDDDYARVLAGHHALIRSALAAHAGPEIDTQGDTFFAVFSSPRACVAAVLQMQEAFAAYGWPGGERVRVRMGSIAGRRRGRPPAWWAWRCTGAAPGRPGWPRSGTGAGAGVGGGGGAGARRAAGGRGAG
jgi:hypothetical protein